ncbi:MAG: glycoside hydrolase family 3 N-terminal domain-containing protein [Myxococcaceae bacterium]
MQRLVAVASLLLSFAAAAAERVTLPNADPARVERVMKSMSPRERVAQLLLAYPQVNKTAKVEVGGVLFVGNALKNIAKATEKIDSSRRRAKVPAFYAVDMEGGDFNRMKTHPALRELPSARELAALDDAQVEAWGLTVGKAMREVGLNMNLAPVLDVAASGHLALNRRSFSGDPAIVERKGSAYARGLLRAGVLPIGKHFPGYGDLAGNSDHELITAPWEIDRLREAMDVFHRSADQLGGVMMANVGYPALGPKPAILNPVLVTMAHDHGWITVTDDVSIKVLGDAVNGDTSEVVRQAFLAGNDLLLTTAPPDWDKGIDYIGVLQELIATSPELSARAELSCRRILAVKDRMGLFQGR